MKNLLTLLAKSIFIPLQLTATPSAVHAGTHKNIFDCNSYNP